MTRQVVITRLIEERADINIGEKYFTVARRDAKGNPEMCPVELIIGALGS